VVHHCTAQVTALANGLASESNVQFVALDTSSEAARYFAKKVLGIHALPAFCAFPKQSRTFYKFKGSSRDAESLLKFLNMTCNQREHKTWALPDNATKASSRKLLSGTTTIDTLSSAAAVTPTNAIVGGLLACAALVVGTVYATTRPGPELADGTTGLNSSKAAGGGRTLQQLLADVDTTIARTSSLLVRLMRARIGLVIAPIEDVPAEVASATASSSQASAPSPPPAAPSAARVDGKGSLARGTSAGARVNAASVVSNTRAVGLQAAESSVTRELVRVTGLSAEQIMAVMQQEGGNVAKATDRLLASTDLQVEVTKT